MPRFICFVTTLEEATREFVQRVDRLTDVQSPNAKVYLPIGNCLMSHIGGPDAMALAYMKSASVRQMAGYILPTAIGTA